MSLKTKIGKIRVLKSRKEKIKALESKKEEEAFKNLEGRIKTFMIEHIAPEYPSNYQTDANPISNYQNNKETTLISGINVSSTVYCKEKVVLAIVSENNY